MKLKPFECQFCKSVFSRNSSLKFHIKSIHASLMNPDGTLNDSALKQLQILKEQQNDGEKTQEGLSQTSGKSVYKSNKK